VSASDRTIIFKRMTSDLVIWHAGSFNLTLSRSSSKVKVIGQSSRSQKEMLLEESARPRVKSFSFKGARAARPINGSIDHRGYHQRCQSQPVQRRMLNAADFLYTKYDSFGRTTTARHVRQHLQSTKYNKV